MEIYSLSVAPTHRRRGVGTSLLDALDRRLAALGIVDVTVAAMLGNEDAQRLHLKRGFQPAEVTLSRLGRPASVSSTRAADTALMLRRAPKITRVPRSPRREGWSPRWRTDWHGSRDAAADRRAEPATTLSNTPACRGLREAAGPSAALAQRTSSGRQRPGRSRSGMARRRERDPAGASRLDDAAGGRVRAWDTPHSYSPSYSRDPGLTASRPHRGSAAVPLRDPLQPPPHPAARGPWIHQGSASITRRTSSP
jgi:hypothetical protein